MALRSITGARPPRRFDGIAFDRVRWEESGDTIAITALDTQVIAPAPDPATPPAYNLSTTEATLASGWYRLVWLDAVGTEEAGPWVSRSDPGTLPPSYDEVRDRSPLLREKYPVGAADPQVEGDLDRVVSDAVGLVQSMTCRVLDETLPAELVGTAYRAVTLKAEQLAVTGAAKFAEQTAAGRRIRSISAGPWSETYFGPDELTGRRGQQQFPMMDPDPRLAEALWALATDECREAFVALIRGQFVPAGQATEFDYRRMGGGYPGGRWRPSWGPDGF